jgi:hypothetical protein
MEFKRSSVFSKLCLVTLIVIVGSGAFVRESLAQIKQPARFEIEFKSSDEPYTIIPLIRDKILLIRDKDKYEGSKKLWNITLLDSLLKEVHNFDVAVKDRFPFIGYEQSGDHVFLLFRDGETTRSDFELIDVDLSSGKELNRFQIKPELDFRITHFSKVGSEIILGGYVSNEPAILLYQMQDNQLKIIPGFFQKNNELSDVRVNQNGTFNVVMVDRNVRNDPKLVFRTFDENGVQLLEDIVPVNEDYALQTIMSSTLVREELMVLGTWGDRQGKQSKGFFSLPVNPFADQKANFIAFGELQHSTDYLSPKRSARIKENTKEDLADQRIPGFTAYTVPFKLEEHPRGFLLLAEVYNPGTQASPYYNSPYANPYYTPYGYNPYWPGYSPGMRMYRPYSYGNNVKNSEEVKTQASLLIAFDASGKVLWDHSMKIDEIKKPSLEQLSDYIVTDSSVYFLHKKESDLMIKVIDLESGSAKEFSEKVKLNEAGDEIRSEKEMEGGVRSWYGKYLYSWGYQTLKNNSKQDRVRDIFYINKIAID